MAGSFVEKQKLNLAFRSSLRLSLYSAAKVVDTNTENNLYK